MYSEQRENISVCVCVRHCLSTLDGDLGIGGGPPGLRVWLDASLPLSKQDREKEGEEKKRKQITEKAMKTANDMR